MVSTLVAGLVDSLQTFQDINTENQTDVVVYLRLNVQAHDITSLEYLHDKMRNQYHLSSNNIVDYIQRTSPDDYIAVLV
jgi:hypothetical protein